MILRRQKIKSKVTDSALGSIGKGMATSYKKGCKFQHELWNNGIAFTPYEFVAPETKARLKNSLTVREFKACAGELEKLYDSHFLGSMHGIITTATGGGTCPIGIQSLKMVSERTEYATAQVFLSNELFSHNLAPDDRARKFINTEVQLSLLAEVIRNSNCSVELISMSKCFGLFGKSYEPVDEGMLEYTSIVNACSEFNNGFDLEDVLSDPKFRIRTVGFRRIQQLDRYEANITRIFSSIDEHEPLLDPAFFDKKAPDNIIGSPTIIICGHPDLVEDAQQRFNSSTEQVRSLQDIHETFGNTNNQSRSPTLVSFPITGLSHIYLASIYPINHDWFTTQCNAAKEQIWDLHRKVAKGQIDSLLVKVYKTMLAQACNPDIHELIGG